VLETRAYWSFFGLIIEVNLLFFLKIRENEAKIANLSKKSRREPK